MRSLGAGDLATGWEEFAKDGMGAVEDAEGIAMLEVQGCLSVITCVHFKAESCSEALCGGNICSGETDSEGYVWRGHCRCAGWA